MGNNATKDSVKREFEDLKKDLNEGSIPKVAAECQERLNEIHNLPLHIAVTGQTGSGKSSLVNAMRGVMDDDKGAAPVGAVEQVMMPNVYPHPSFPNIKIWDLPGTGTFDFKAVDYLKKVNFEIYDVFIIVASERFTEYDALLAKEIQNMNKKFYYVRSKMDISIKSEKRKRDFSKEETLKAIRNYCQRYLKRAGTPSAGVFLVSSQKVHKYDFPLLQETIAAELPDHKKDILTLAVHIFSEDKLMRKKEAMKSYINNVAWVSCVFGVVPIPGLSMATDIGILLVALKYICNAFGLDDQSLRFLALQTGKQFKELKSAVKKTPLLSELDEKLVYSLLLKSSVWLSVSAVEFILNFIPVVGSVFGGVSSYFVTHHFLNRFLDDAVEDARNVQAKFLKQSEWSQGKIQGSPNVPFE